MAKRKPNNCYLCGSPAVKTHIVPRALMHDMRQGSGHLVVGGSNFDGVAFRQSGEWEYLLCDHHERKLHAADTYGIDFCRRAQIAASSAKDEYFEVANPSPHLLLRFGLSVIWRHVHSESGSKLRLTLGPHEAAVRDAIFNEASTDYQLTLCTSTHSIKGKPVEIAMFPSRGRLLGRNIWHFTLARIDFMVSVSIRSGKRPFAACQHL